jgi:hypothetical protein
VSHIRGPGPARIAWGYRTAAELEAWTIQLDRGTPDDPQPFRRTLVAALVGRPDLHALKQRPLTFVVVRDPPLAWPIVPGTLTIGLEAVTAELEAKEDAPYVAIRSAGK